MIVLEIAIVLGAIYFGSRLGSIGIGYAGGVGVLLLALTLFFASMLLYSQAATTRALMPTAIALGASSVTIVASFPAVVALFVLPTYPTLLAAIEMDDTGSTKIGKYVFNHSFILPGVILLTLSVAFGFLFGGLFL